MNPRSSPAGTRPLGGGAAQDAPPKLAATTTPYPRRPEWGARVADIPLEGSSLRLVREILKAAKRYPVLVHDGSITLPGSPDLIAALILSRRRRRPAIVLTDCNWKSADGPMKIARRLGMRLIDRAVTAYGVYTVAETRDFAARWGVDPAKVRFTPYYYNLTDEELAAPPRPHVPGGVVFAGGNSLRDYPTLIAAARGLDAKVRIATTKPVAGPPPPPNVEIGGVPHAEYMRLAYEAALNVVPMLPGLERCAGLETYVTAMAMGKLTIISDTPGVRDYVEHERTGLIVPAGDPGALREAIAWALDPANAARAEQIALAGMHDARERFSPEVFVGLLLDAVDDALAARGAAGR